MRFLSDTLRAIARLLALIFSLAGLAVLGLLGYLVLFGNGMASDVLGKVWFQNHLASLNLFQAIVQRRISPELWDPGIVTVLGWPSWMALLSVAAALLVVGWLLFRFKRPGYRSA